MTHSFQLHYEPLPNNEKNLRTGLIVFLTFFSLLLGYNVYQDHSASVNNAVGNITSDTVDGFKLGTGDTVDGVLSGGKIIINGSDTVDGVILGGKIIINNGSDTVDGVLSGGKIIINGSDTVDGVISVGRVIINGSDTVDGFKQSTSDTLDGYLKGFTATDRYGNASTVSRLTATDRYGNASTVSRIVNGEEEYLNSQNKVIEYNLPFFIINNSQFKTLIPIKDTLK